MSSKKIFLPLGLLLIGALWNACVDIPSDPSSNINPNFRSMVRFVHAAPGVAAGNVVVDAAVVASGLPLGPNTTYYDLPAGSRSVAFGGAAALTVSLGSEQQSTVAIYPLGTGVGFLNLVEGHKDKNNGTPGVARVKFVNVGQGSASNVTFRSDSANGAELAAGVGFANAGAYRDISPGSRAVFGISNGGYLAALNAGQEVPPVTTPTLSSGTGTADLTVDGGLSYSITVKSENKQGMYIGAHIHNGPSGVAAGVVFPISVDSQNVSFTVVQLGGANEVPPVTTTSTGTASLALNSARGVIYSATITSDNTQGFYIFAHFHNAAAGINGGVVNPIDVTKQRMTFDTTRLSGANEVPPMPTTATGFGTFTLYRDSLVYSVTVTRDAVDTTFTAAHFHNGSAGVIGNVVRTIRDSAWSNPTRTFTGTWKRTDTQPLTDSMVAEIIRGRIYVNVHSTGRPVGIIRGPLSIRPTTTNTFSGTWSDASLTVAMKNEFAKRNMYLNFHTANNPGGQIRGQAIPDTFTTNLYTGVWKDATLIDSLKQQFNLGRMYFNFHTVGNPGGEIRGQLTVDASKGEYGLASLPASAFNAGRMYTVVATGKGSTFQLLNLTDRQAGVTKPASPPEMTTRQKVNE